jgi:nucleotide-binding universal stress UspA family protein
VKHKRHVISLAPRDNGLFANKSVQQDRTAEFVSKSSRFQEFRQALNLAWFKTMQAQSTNFLCGNFSRARGTMSFQRILIAVDGQPMSLRAGELGAELGRALGSEIALINVVDVRAEFDQSELQSKTFLSGFRERLSLPPAAHDFAQIGIPAPRIVETPKEWSADVIVIASHGRAGVSRALFGSVAEQVMRNAPCPVLVVRTQM